MKIVYKEIFNSSKYKDLIEDNDYLRVINN